MGCADVQDIKDQGVWGVEKEWEAEISGASPMAMGVKVEEVLPDAEKGSLDK